MKTPARAVFATLAAARELKTKERAELMREACDIVMVAQQSVEYMTGLKAHYSKIFEGAVPEHGHGPMKTAAGAVPWDVASRVMLSAMRIKKRLECGQ